MSKRRLFLYALLLGILIWSLPFFIGQYIEVKYFQFASRISEFETIDLKPISYERHWRRSKAKTRVILSNIAWQKWLSLLNYPAKQTFEKIPPLPFVLEHEILHGPFIQMHKDNWLDWKIGRVFIRSKLSLTEEARSILEAEAGVSELVHIESAMNLLDGTLTVSLEGPAFRTREQTQTEQSAWGGVNGNWEINSSFDEIKGQILIPGFNFDIYDDTYQASDLAFFGDRNRDKDGFWKGTWRANIQKLLLDDVIENVKLKLVGLVISGLISEKGDLADSSFLFRAEQLNYQDELLAPVTFNLSVYHIPKHIMLLIKTLIQTKPVDAPWFDYIFLNQNILRALPGILEARPELNLDKILLQTSKGPVTGEFGFVIGGKGASNVAKPEQVMQSILAKAYFVIPKDIFRDLLEAKERDTLGRKGEPEETLESKAIDQANDKIHRWIHDGYLKEDKGNYILDMEFSQGQLKSHGVIREIPDDLF